MRSQKSPDPKRHPTFFRITQPPPPHTLRRPDSSFPRQADHHNTAAWPPRAVNSDYSHKHHMHITTHASIDRWHNPSVVTITTAGAPTRLTTGCIDNNPQAASVSRQRYAHGFGKGGGHYYKFKFRILIIDMQLLITSRTGTWQKEWKQSYHLHNN